MLKSFSYNEIPAFLKLLFVALFCMTALSGCGSTDNSKDYRPLSKNDKNGNNNQQIEGVDYLSAETVWQIRQDYSNYEIARVGYAYPDITVDNVFILTYYGTYNNAVVVKMNRTQPSPAELPDLIIGETLLPNPISSIIVWKEGRIYELRNAYDQGLLTMENMRIIAYYIWGREVNLESHAGLIKGSLNCIINTYLLTYLKPYFPEAVFNDIQIVNYYGSYKYFEAGTEDISFHARTYNDHVAVMMNSKYDVYFDEYREETVAGTLFQYSNENRILLWEINRDEWEYIGLTGRFYELQEAYDLGILTEDNIRSIAYYHETGKMISYNQPVEGWR